MFKYPILRGLGTLGQAMTLGVKALQVFGQRRARRRTPRSDGKKPAEISSWMMTANLVFSLGFFIFLYKFVPLFLATQLGKLCPRSPGASRPT